MRATEKLRAEIERDLLHVILTQGLAGVRAFIAAIDPAGSMTPSFAKGSVRVWRGAFDGKSVEVQTCSAGLIRSARIAYSRRTQPILTPAERTRQILREQFYARYVEVGPARVVSVRQLSRADRVVRAIGDLEADLNNGGFTQYLDNKGVRKARRTLAILRQIGAERTARLLSLALTPRESTEPLDALWHRRPDDLATIVMRSLAIEPVPSVSTQAQQTNSKVIQRIGGRS